MLQNWSSSPLWLRVLSLLGIPWAIAFIAIGVPLLFTSGPGLPLIILGLLGLSPWVFIASRQYV